MNLQKDNHLAGGLMAILAMSLATDLLRRIGWGPRRGSRSFADGSRYGRAQLRP